MSVDFDKFSVHEMLMKPTKWFGFPKIKDKIGVLEWLNSNADLGDIQFVYPIIFERNRELATAAAQVVWGIMRNIKGRDWNEVYDQIKYT